MGIFAPPQGAWLTYTPTWGNLTIGNATVSARYYQVGKLVTVRIEVTAGTTTTASTGVVITGTLPVTAVATTATTPIGVVRQLKVAVNAFYGLVRFASTTTFDLAYGAVSGASVVEGASQNTIATSDTLLLSFTYEAA